MKNAEMRAFSDPYFPVYGQNRIHIFLYWTYSPILSKYGKIQTWFYSYKGKYGSEKTRGYDQKRELFTTNSFVY